MCGRYAATLPPAVFRDHFGYSEQHDFPPRFNIAPTQPVAIVRRLTEERGPPVRHLQLVRWGFVPAFVKHFDSFKPIFNAWCEGVTERPSFRNAFRRRRCLFIADGFYAWRKDGKTSKPFLLRRVDRQPFGMAGMSEPWLGADGSEIETACIITAPAPPAFASITARVPVLVATQQSDLWLDPDEREATQAVDLLQESPGSSFEAIPIGVAVNAVARDEAAIQQPIGPALPLA